MPSISNVQLRFLNTGVEEWKTVNVSYTVNFSNLEVYAGIIFQAISSIHSYDGPLDEDPNFHVQGAQGVVRNYIRATNEPVSMTDSTIIMTSRLNEDPDRVPQDPPRIPPVIIIKNIKDEWFARVTLSPVVFNNAIAQSPVVTGSWGPGSDL